MAGQHGSPTHHPFVLRLSRRERIKRELTFQACTSSRDGAVLVWRSLRKERWKHQHVLYIHPSYGYREAGPAMKCGSKMFENSVDLQIPGDSTIVLGVRRWWMHLTELIREGQEKLLCLVMRKRRPRKKHWMKIKGKVSLAFRRHHTTVSSRMKCYVFYSDRT